MRSRLQKHPTECYELQSANLISDAYELIASCYTSLNISFNTSSSLAFIYLDSLRDHSSIIALYHYDLPYYTYSKQASSEAWYLLSLGKVSRTTPFSSCLAMFCSDNNKLTPRQILGCCYPQPLDNGGCRPCCFRKWPRPASH